MIGFRCDYLEGCHPTLLQALVDSNEEQCNGYGLDEYSQGASEKIRHACKAAESQVHFVIGGTATNKTVLAWLLRPWQGVLAAETGHIAVHETGAIEATGHKVMTLPQKEGKVSPEDVAERCQLYATSDNKEHEVEPAVLYVSQPTEYGTLYSLAELTGLRQVCDQYGLSLFVDGARLGYGLASPSNDVTLPDLARLCEVFYIGGTKCGALCGEAVVIRQDMGDKFRHILKQSVGILAKGRVMGIQFDALFTEGLYQEICTPAVEIALELAEAFRQQGVPLAIDSPTNQQFPILTQKQQEHLAQYATFEQWEALPDGRAVVRFCSSWATKKEKMAELYQGISAIGKDGIV